MDVEEKVSTVLRDTEEVITVEELRSLIEAGCGKGYLGFEPSGIFHVGWLVWAFKFKDLVDVGFDMYLLAATWHAWINDKFGGDMELIRAAAKHVVDVLNSIGLEGRFKLVCAEELVDHAKYWGTLLRCAKEVSLARIKRALTIMGRTAEEGETDFSKLIYPLMQVTDIFELDLDLALGGLDQRKAHMLARDIAEKLGKKKVVAVHTPLIPSLLGPGRMDVSIAARDDRLAQAKMSKSKPETAIFITDGDEEIRSKIRRAYCPPREVQDNPILSIAKHIIFRGEEKEFVINRPAQYGGSVTVWSYGELEKLYVEGKIHPLDIKNAVAEYLIRIVAPIRERVSKSEEVGKIREFLRSRK
ncbi:MAG: tyrosine--tRNA ligase [Desulfurococcales archaeon]|nr:tyrosine--tRNA ligase [Desulfurococcales archaeon]